jgi:hypothetical protein
VLVLGNQAWQALGPMLPVLIGNRGRQNRSRAPMVLARLRPERRAPPAAGRQARVALALERPLQLGARVPGRQPLVRPRAAH